MKTRRGMTLMIVVLSISLLLSACGTPATPAPTQAPAQPAQPAQPSGGGAKTYVLVPKNLGNPYFDTANSGAQEAAKELGVTVNYQGPATADATQQIQLLNALIAQKVNGLAISALAEIGTVVGRADHDGAVRRLDPRIFPGPRGLQPDGPGKIQRFPDPVRQEQRRGRGHPVQDDQG